MTGHKMSVQMWKKKKEREKKRKEICGHAQVPIFKLKSVLNK